MDLPPQKIAPSMWMQLENIGSGETTHPAQVQQYL